MRQALVGQLTRCQSMPSCPSCALIQTCTIKGRGAWMANKPPRSPFAAWWGREKYQSLSTSETFIDDQSAAQDLRTGTPRFEPIRRRRRSIGELSAMPRRELARAWKCYRAADLHPPDSIHSRFLAGLCRTDHAGKFTKSGFAKSGVARQLFG